MKRYLLIPIILTQALSANALGIKLSPAQDEKLNAKLAEYNQKLQDLCKDEKNVNLDEVAQKSKSIWKQLTDELKTAPLEWGYDIGKVNLADHSVIEVGKKTKNDPSVGGQFSSMDKWIVDANLLLAGSDALDLRIDANREITFIQQFPTKCTSVARVAYDPITKTPLNSERALNRLKEGDFVAFTAPLTLSLGKAADTFFAGSNALKNMSFGGLYMSGEFDVHVYRMKNNYVRVRFFASQSKKFSFEPGIKFYALEATLGHRAVLRPFGLELSKTLTDLFSADYVFNLDNQLSRDMYDQVMGHKFELSNMAFDGINPFISDNTVKSRLFSDLEQLDNVSASDRNLALEKRRIIRLSRADSKTTSTASGISMDIKLVGLKQKATYSDSNVDVTNASGEQQKYKIKTIIRESEAHLLEVLGVKDLHNTALLLQTDGQYNPLSSIGLQTIRVKENKRTSKDDLIGLKNRLTKTLPSQIRAVLNLPDTDNMKINLGETHIEQSIYLDAQVLESQDSITYAKIKHELEKLMVTWGVFSSLPMSDGSAQVCSNDEPNSRFCAFEKATRLAQAGKNASREYMEAYNWEIEYITQDLTTLFKKGVAISDKIAAYDQLQGMDLFSEIGISLVLNLINQSDRTDNSPLKMKDVVSYRLEITGHGMEPKVSEYPQLDRDANGVEVHSANQKKSEIFKRLLNDNNYLQDRSFNLRYYMDEKGQPISLKEVVDRNSSLPQ